VKFFCKNFSRVPIFKTSKVFQATLGRPTVLVAKPAEKQFLYIDYMLLDDVASTKMPYNNHADHHVSPAVCLSKQHNE
jgi:hypothetical protein